MTRYERDVRSARGDNFRDTLTVLFFIAIIVLLSAPFYGCATTPKWDNTEKLLMGTLIAGQVVDGAQTHSFQERGMHEGNTMAYGSHASGGELAASKGAACLAVALAVELVPSHKVRKWILGGANVVTFGTVGWNAVQMNK